MSKRKRWIGGCFLLLLFCFLAYYHQVPKQITPEDEEVLEQYLAIAQLEHDHLVQQSPYSFALELRTIRQLQQAVQQHNPPGKGGIPEGVSRQPRELYASGIGQCYDRAYTLAKLYRFCGWSTRHVALYRNDPESNDLGELLSFGTQSHASLEVKTTKGWMIVDPDQPFIGLATDSLPHGYFEVPLTDKLAWQDSIPPGMNWQLTNNPIQVYGLYSRHGKFFPPYNFIPDVHWGEVLGNF